MTVDRSGPSRPPAAASILRSDRSPTAVLRRSPRRPASCCETDRRPAALLDEERGFLRCGSSGRRARRARRLPAPIPPCSGPAPRCWIRSAPPASPSSRSTCPARVAAPLPPYAGHPASCSPSAARRVRTVGILVLANRLGGGPHRCRRREAARRARPGPRGGDGQRSCCCARCCTPGAGCAPPPAHPGAPRGRDRRPAARGRRRTGHGPRRRRLHGGRAVQGDALRRPARERLGEVEALRGRVLTLPAQLTEMRRSAASGATPLVYGRPVAGAPEFFEVHGSTSTSGPALIHPAVSAPRSLTRGAPPRTHPGQPCPSPTASSTSPRRFAAQASVALELESASQVQEKLLLVEERDRIARDLHDHVVQRLFATGLSLQRGREPAGRRNPASGSPT